MTSPTPLTRAAHAAAGALPSIEASGRALQRRLTPEVLLRLAAAALLVLASFAVIALSLRIRIDPPTATVPPPASPATSAVPGADGAPAPEPEAASLPEPVAPAAPTATTATELDGYPTAAADSAQVEEDKDARIFVLDNDAAGGAPLDVSTLRIVSAPALAKDVAIDDGHIRYKAEKDVTGTDSFEYVICNVAELCATARVTITVTDD